LKCRPRRKKQCCQRYPEILAELKTAYDAWFDDVKSSRQFAPGYIHLGSDAENPAYLCRYQDSAYINQKPTGWPVYPPSQKAMGFARGRRRS